MKKKETVDHPAHYGGANNPYEVIEVIEAWDLNFRVGNAVKYIGRAGRRGGGLKELADIEKAIWYLRREAFFLASAIETSDKRSTE